MSHITLIQRPLWIPCITTKISQENLRVFEKNEKHLISVSPQIPFIKARDLTLVDCRTFGLIRNPHINPLKHYLWFIDFAKEIEKEKDIVFIPPDADWLGSELDLKLAQSWLEQISSEVKCLVVPGTALFDLLKGPVGYAIRPAHEETHSVWTHSLGREHSRKPKKTKLWTYDSIYPV